MPPRDFTAFTTDYNGIVPVLLTDAQVAAAYSPKSPPPKIQWRKCKAIWDTGATKSVIIQQIIDDCGLTQVGVTNVQYAQGSGRSGVYLVNILMPNNLEAYGIRVTRGDLGSAGDLLIGMDIIATGDFSITNTGNKTTFSFRFPSIKRVCYVEEARKINASRANSRCSCGSGKKYKNCHGKGKV